MIGMIGSGSIKARVGGLLVWPYVEPELRPFFKIRYPALVRSPIFKRSRRVSLASMSSRRFFVQSGAILKAALIAKQ